MSRTRIIALYKQGYTRDQIARTVQVPLHRVKSVLQQYYADVQAERVKASKPKPAPEPASLPDISEPSYQDETDLPEQD